MDGTPEVNANALKIAVKLTVREDVYQEKIVNTLSRLLDDVTLHAGLNEELKDAPISNRQAATLYIMGANLSFKGWNLPKDFFDAFQRGCERDSSITYYLVRSVLWLCSGKRTQLSVSSATA